MTKEILCVIAMSVLWCPIAFSQNKIDRISEIDIWNLSALQVYPGTYEANWESLSRYEVPEWFREAKFGLFIHWGIYSKHARGEWVMNREKIPVAEYAKLAETFNPVKFNADQWVAVAKNAGMKYITITSKHHDGFCIFDTVVDNYNIVDGTPFKRDVLNELKEACDKAGIKLGFYYSHAQDWYHPGGSGKKWDPVQKGDFRTYLDTVSIPQIKELLTQYEPTHLWFDTPHGMNADIGRELVGVNLIPYVLGQKQGPPHSAIFWRNGGRGSIVSGSADKLVNFGSKGRGELYHLPADVSETKNLIAVQTEMTNGLKLQWEQWNQTNLPCRILSPPSYHRKADQFYFDAIPEAAKSEGYKPKIKENF